MADSKNVTYRLETETTELIDGLAADLTLSKTDVVRRAVATLRELLTVAAADANAMLEVIRDRHPDADELTVDVTQGPDGTPRAIAKIDGAEVPDVGAVAMVDGDRAVVFVTIPDGEARLLVPIGGEYLLVRPKFPVNEVAWPPRNQRVVLPLRAAEPARPVEAQGQKIEV
jgi:hypothetical protein